MIIYIYTFSIILNSCFQLSAISSVAILNDTQQAALQYVITRSAQDSKCVASKLLARVQGLGYSGNDLKKYVFESGDVCTYTLIRNCICILSREDHSLKFLSFYFIELYSGFAVPRLSSSTSNLIEC